MKLFFATLILAGLISCSRKPDAKEFLTYYEKSGYLKTPHYDATIDFCKKMAEASPYLSFTTFGESPRGLGLPLLIADKNQNFSIEEVRHSDNIVVLIQACIHAGESEGKDAGMMLMRDIAVLQKYPELLEHVTILFIPIFNVDGHERFSAFNRINQNGPMEMGWRTTAKNLNLNRDFMKADAPEMRDWLKLYNMWLPEFFFDCHTTDGADYQYTLTYGLEVSGNTEAKLSNWMKNIYMKDIEQKMKEQDVLIFPYVGFRNWHDPRSGLESWVAPPMLGDGYAAVQNRASLLIETHMLKDYKTRVNATYEILKQSLITLNKEYKNLKQLVKSADEYTASAEFRKTAFPLSFKQSKDSEMVSFKGFAYTSEKSDLSGGEWFKYSQTPQEWKIPYFNKQVIAEKAMIPEAYIIPPEWQSVISRLDLHGIKYRKLKQSQKFKVVSYIFKNVIFSNKSYEGRQRVQKFDMDEITEDRKYPIGSVIVQCNQRTARVIAHMFEPKAYDSFVNWGFFSSIFEQKEYGESYVLEPLARKMLANDAKLKTEFEKKMEEDKEFAESPEAILNWFYLRSEYRDKQINIYPVGKLY